MTLPLVAEWMLMKQDEVLDKFQSLESSFTDGEGQKRFVYVPGTRKDKVLLVAHADTKFLDSTINLGYHDGIVFSKARDVLVSTNTKHGVTHARTGLGIGADDRAGCAIIWELRNLGHSILITSGEEIGCVASKRIMANPWWVKELNNNHRFAVQFDRRGHKDIVFYNIGTKDFAKYVQDETGYTPEGGTYTDIREICRSMCGVNISVGFYNEHTSSEMLVVDQWRNTLETARAWLSKSDIPRFDLDKTNLFSPYATSNAHSHWGSQGHDYGYSDWPYREWQQYAEEEFAKREAKKTSKTNVIRPEDRQAMATLTLDSGSDERLQCPYCYASISQEEWFKNHLRCKHCDKEF